MRTEKHNGTPIDIKRTNLKGPSRQNGVYFPTLNPHMPFGKETVCKRRNLQQEANLISRMERMPLNKALLTLVGLLSWCWVMEAFDLA